jgi:hypothetical protein
MKGWKMGSKTGRQAFLILLAWEETLQRVGNLEHAVKKLASLNEECQHDERRQRQQLGRPP